MKHQRFIVLEGIDGVGKSTLSLDLVDHLNRQGITSVHLDTLPIPRFLSPEQKRWANTQASVEASFRLYLASAAHKATAIAQYTQTAWVVADRHVASVWAHHLASGLDESLLLRRSELETCEAGIVFNVVLPEDVRQRRLHDRGEVNPADLESASDVRTLLGRKRYWFDRLIDVKIDNSGIKAETLESIMSHLDLK